MKKLFFLILFLSSFSTYAQDLKILVPYRVGDKWGYSDTLGNIKIPAKYEWADPFIYPDFTWPKKVYAVVSDPGIKYVIDNNGKTVFSGKYREIEINYLINGVSFIVTDDTGKAGVFTSSKPLIPVIYDFVIGSYNDSYIISKGEKYGLINSEGRLILPVEFDNINAAVYGNDKNYEWRAEKNGVTKRVKDKRVVNKNPDRFTPPMIVADNMVAREININWKEELKNKWQADSIVEADLAEGDDVWILYRKDKQAVYFESQESTELNFFDTAYRIKNVYPVYEESTDAHKYNTRFLLHTLYKGKHGLITDKTEILVPPDLDGINYLEDQHILELVKGEKLGMFIFNTVYSYIPPKYQFIQVKYSVPVNQYWNFSIYQVMKNEKTFYVGENGVEYYSQK